MMQQFERHTQMFDLKLDATESRIRTELHQSLRLNLLVTIGVLGTLITVVGALT